MVRKERIELTEVNKIIQITMTLINNIVAVIMDP